MLRIVSLGTLGVYWLVIFIGTHMPHGVQGLGRFYDKFLHFGAYAGLAFLLAAALTTLRVRHGAVLLPLIISAVYGCLDELSQIPIPGRHADIVDWVADVAGAGFGVLAFSMFSLALAKRFAPPATAKCKTVTKSAA
ncbi:MAG TPA: VanZ family protein [Pirellulaceae bacterium]|nr:VanZ family protein [Pirellulaceae bacterium]